GSELLGETKSRLTGESIAKLHDLIPAAVYLASEPLFFVEFGSAMGKILQAAAACNRNLIVRGLRHVDEARTGRATWARAYEIVSKANCPVLTVRDSE